MDDLISRRQAIDALGEAPKYKPRIIKTYAEGRNDQWFDDVAKLTLMPSAQSERRKGKWNTYYHSDIEFSHSCNQCGYSAPYQMIGGKVFQREWNFCPNCGSDMRGDESEDT